MRNGQQSLLENIQTLFEGGKLGERTDRQLLAQLQAGDRAAAELAFAVLVQRHGPMVYRACRAILRDQHDAEDAFQATFLLLARKAPALWVKSSLGPWLFQVACRVASCAHSAAVRRRSHERKAALPAASTVSSPTWDDRDAIVRDEVGRLPERYRVPVVLCLLEGMTQDEAACQLGWRPGTLRSRLARGRDRLRARLTRRGLAPAEILTAAPNALEATAGALPAGLAEATVSTIFPLAGSQAKAGAIASVLALADGVSRIMIWSKFKLLAAVVLAAGSVAGGTALVAQRGAPFFRVASAHEQSRTQAANALTGAAASPQREPEPAPVSSIAKARLSVARTLRDMSLRLFQEGELDLAAYLAAQKRYNDVVGEETVKTEADRVRFHQTQVATLKELEQTVRELYAQGRKTQADVLTVQLDRLGAEEALARAKARVSRLTSDTARARLDAVKKLLASMRDRWQAGEVDIQSYLTWKQRHDAIEDELLSAGPEFERVLVLEGRVAAIKEIEAKVQELYERGQVSHFDLEAVKLYRLDAEDAVARLKAENPDEAPDPPPNESPPKP
jgi:RNA polymerase sigma factor (sigma-70 family)